MNKRDVLRWSALLTVILAGLAPFQNCSDVSFSPGAQEPLAVPVVEKNNCQDSDGRIRMHGDAWSISAPFEEMLPCPDAPIRMQKYVSTQGYLCDDGTIQPTNFANNPIDMAPECPAPKIAASIGPSLPAEGSTAELTVTTEYVSNVTYSCTNAATGSLTVGASRTPLVIKEDLSCLVEATNSAGVKVSALANAQVDCGKRMKENGKCRDFECKTIVPLVLGSDFIVPARTAEGVCYSMKLMDKIGFGSSSLTKVIDPDVVSRNHDSGGGTRNSYVLGKSNLKFNLAGTRTVKLSGSGTNLQPIKVDNFIVSGFFPFVEGQTSDIGFYRSYGTADSMIQGTDYVKFRNLPLKLKSFGDSGTSTIAPLDITADVIPGVLFEMDLRALDCGGSRELSDIYLLFQ